VKGEIEAAVEALKAALKDGSADDIKTKTQELTQTAMKLGEAIYKAAQEEGAAGDGGPSSSNADDVVDADFEEVDENKRDDKN